MDHYNDLAIPIAWPDQTARGDEKWMAFFRKIGVVKNLNFKVGHAAMVLVERESGDLKYFDFGRYICPRGYGRARSADADPRLSLTTKAQISSQGSLTNLEEILNELASIEEATHGGGRLLCSVSDGISYAKAVEFAEQLVRKGPILYGALANNNNSCSRYVAQTLVHGMPSNDKRIRAVLYPESLKASPTSNVVNATSGNYIYCFDQGRLESWPMNRWGSLRFQIRLLEDNFTVSGAKRLADDTRIGDIEIPEKTIKIPRNAQWLGGIGEGRWYFLDHKDSTYHISRYDVQGNLEYEVPCYPDKPFDESLPYKFTFHIHHKQHVVQQGANEIKFLTQQINPSDIDGYHSHINTKNYSKII